MMVIDLLIVLLLLAPLGYGAVILFFFSGLRSLRPGTGTHEQSFSVVIAARNEERLITRCLNSVMAQDYPSSLFEVIVVDDRSTDSTPQKVQELQGRYPNLKLVSVAGVPSGVSPKKNALSTGIALAKNDILLFTDADCVVPGTWIRSHNSHFNPETGAVGGLTTYHPVSGMNSLLYGLQAMDFFSHSVVSASAIGAGLPINTNANNFAVRRKLFLSVNGYDRVKKIVSGDDDLLLQAISLSGEAVIDYAPEIGAAVTTEPSVTLRQIWEQRKRWSSKTVYYGPRQVRILAFIFGYYFLLCVGLLLSFLSSGLFLAFLLSFTVKTLLDFFLAYRGMVLFGERALVRYFPLAALLHVPLIVGACLFGVFGKFTWKGARSGRTLSPNGNP